jgi:hypothetical protein
VGGFDDDTYIASKRGVTVVMDYGNTDGEDVGIAKGIGLSRQYKTHSCLQTIPSHQVF